MDDPMVQAVHRLLDHAVASEDRMNKLMQRLEERDVDCAGLGDVEQIDPKQVNRLLGHQLALWGVLPTLYDSRARICREALETLQKTFQEVCLEPVHFAIRAKEAPAHGKTLFEYAPTSPAAVDYGRVVKRLLGVSEESQTSEELEATA